MTPLARKVASLLPDLEKRGPVYLFAFVEREDVSRWDVVVSAEWSDQEMSTAVFFVSKTLFARLAPPETAMLARVVIIPSDAPDIRDMPASWNGTTPPDEKVIYADFLGLDVRRAFVFKAQIPPRHAPTTSLPTAGVVHS